MVQDIECEAELVLATLMESQQAESLSQQPQPGPAGGRLGAAPNSVVPGDTPYGARGRHQSGLLSRTEPCSTIFRLWWLCNHTWCCSATQGHGSCSCASLSEYFVCLAQLLSNCVSFSQGLPPVHRLATLPECSRQAARTDWYSNGSVVVPDKSGYVAGGRTPGTALHGNMRTPATGARQTPASNSGRPAQNPLNTVAAATTRPSRFMQGAARGGRPAGQQAAPDDTPVVPARPASEVGTEASNKGPTSGESSSPSIAWQGQKLAAIGCLEHFVIQVLLEPLF